MGSDKWSDIKKGKFKYIMIRSTVMMLLLGGLSVVMLILLTVYRQESVFYILVLVGLYVFLGAIVYFGYRFLYKPYRDTEKVCRLFSEGYLLQGLFELRVPLSPQMEAATNKFRELLNMKELISLTKKQAEYLALQNQINPHFLYNTLEGIRSEALYAGIDSVAEMTEALATFFRYTISNVEHLVTLEDELANTENYYIIQQFRFGKRLKYHVEIDSEEEREILKYKLPKLILQPIVENAIYHGIERKTGDGLLCIKIENTDSRFIITISDNGLGMSEAIVDGLNEKLKTTSIDTFHQDKKGGSIAIENVNNRIKILFGEEYGIYIYSKQNVGTDVEITLPIVKD